MHKKGGQNRPKSLGIHVSPHVLTIHQYDLSISFEPLRECNTYLILTYFEYRFIIFYAWNTFGVRLMFEVVLLLLKMSLLMMGAINNLFDVCTYSYCVFVILIRSCQSLFGRLVGTPIRIYRFYLFCVVKN